MTTRTMMTGAVVRRVPLFLFVATAILATFFAGAASAGGPSRLLMVDLATGAEITLHEAVSTTLPSLP